MFEGSFEVLGKGEMRVRVECCIWGRNVQGRGAGSYVASELHGREEIESAEWDSTQECVSLQLDWELAKGRCWTTVSYLDLGLDGTPSLLSPWLFSDQ